MNNRKYCVVKYHKEFSKIKYKNFKYREDITIDHELDDHSEILSIFDTLDEAREELATCENYCADYGTYYLVCEYYIEDMIPDEDGEFFRQNILEQAKEFDIPNSLLSYD